MMVRLTANGKLDDSFGDNGVVISNVTENKSEYIRSIVQQEDGKIVAAGGDFTIVTPTSEMLVVRYNPDGSLDKSYGKNGTAIIGFFKNAEANAIALLKNGKILVGGGTYQKQDEGSFALCRLNIDGSLDNTFGIDGKQTTDFLITSIVYSLALQKDGNIVASGISLGEDYPYSLALARYIGDPAKQQNPLAKKIRRWMKKHILNWQGLQDDDIAYYSVEKSSNGVNGFKEIGRVKAVNRQSLNVKGNEQRTMNNEQSSVYSFNISNASSSDIQHPASNIQTYYRIRAVSNNGSNVVSDVISDESFASISVSPNPVKDVLKISGLPVNQKSTINIVSRNGNVLQSAICNTSIYNINVAQLHAGLYNVQVVINGKTQTVKFVKE